MYTKMRLKNVIPWLTAALAFTGGIFYVNKVDAYAVEVTAEQILQNAMQSTGDSLNTDQAAAQTPAVLIPTTTYIATESSHSLAIVLPEKLDVGNPAYNLESVTGYRLHVYKDSTEISNSGTAYYEAGTGIVDLESLIRSLSLKLTNVSENLRFKIVYIGKNASGEYVEAKDIQGNVLEWMSDILSVYRVSISGDHINPAFTYGFSGQTIVLIPSLTENYTFTQWSDGSMQNPRIVLVSTNNSENEYTAIATLPDVIVSANADGGYDIIPQTGEKNSTFWLICMSVFGVLGTGYVLFSMVIIPARKMSSGYDDDQF